MTMHQTDHKANKFRDSLGTLLGLFVSIPINLLSTWFQWNVLSNIFLDILIFIGLLFIFYYLIKRQNLLLFVALLSFVASFLVNLLSNMIQQNIMHNSFSLAIVMAIIGSPVVGLIICSWLKLHPLQPIRQQATFPSETKSYNTQ